MLNDSNLVSVIIPTRNRLNFLERSIISVQAQTWKNIEIIVIDDASSDRTNEFLHNISKLDPRIKFLCHKYPLGGAAARNSGINLSSGKFIAFLDDDDIWLPEKIDLQINALRANSDASGISCSFYLEDNLGRRKFKRVAPPIDDQQILLSNHLGGASMCLTTREALNRIGGFDITLRSSQDWDLWMKLYDLGTILVCAEPLVCYMPHEGDRITTNPVSTYTGRRRFYFRYRSRMSKMTRFNHLCELLYCRKVLLRNDRFSGLFKLLNIVGTVRAIRYFNRYFRARRIELYNALKI